MTSCRSGSQRARACGPSGRQTRGHALDRQLLGAAPSVSRHRDSDWPVWVSSWSANRANAAGLAGC